MKPPRRVKELALHRTLPLSGEVVSAYSDEQHSKRQGMISRRGAKSFVATRTRRREDAALKKLVAEGEL